MCIKALKDDWEFDVLGIANYRKPHRLAHYFEFIIENNSYIPGDLCEAGVYRGNSLLGTALLLRELGSSKQIWAFDTFSGFPSYHPYDDLEQFDDLYAGGQIGLELYEKIRLRQKYHMLFSDTPVTPATLSPKGNFANTSLEILQLKIEYLGLENIRIIPGDFADTMNGHPDLPTRFCGALIDCDLYEGHRIALSFIWSRLSQGGYIFLDDYYSLKYPGARIAVDEFFEKRQDKPQMHQPIPSEYERSFARKLYEANPASTNSISE